MEEVHYLVIGKTGIMSNNETIGSSDNVQLNFLAEPWMSPEANVMIFTIHYSGEVIYDKVSLVFEDALSNQVDI